MLCFHLCKIFLGPPDCSLFHVLDWIDVFSAGQLNLAILPNLSIHDRAPTILYLFYFLYDNNNGFVKQIAGTSIIYKKSRSFQNHEISRRPAAKRYIMQFWNNVKRGQGKTKRTWMETTKKNMKKSGSSTDMVCGNSLGIQRRQKKTWNNWLQLIIHCKNKKELNTIFRGFLIPFWHFIWYA